ncbi:hypothetical protein H8D91_02345 [archaeon]|nr:hypothetical protein [archaeon]
MAKGLASKLKTGALISAGLIALAGTLKADAGIIDYIDTTISGGSYGGDLDQDLTREGIQLRYDWTVHNASDQNNTSDALFVYAIQDNLEAKGMYGFTNIGPGNTWDYINGSTSEFNMVGVLDTPPILPGASRTFSAFIDEELAIDNETVKSYGLSNNGPTNLVDVTVPIPEATTLGALVTGAAVLLGARRIRENAKRR